MVTDSDIQRIIDENEAGVGDLMDAYINAESYYFAAVRRLDPERMPPSYITSSTSANGDEAGSTGAVSA